MRNLGKRAPHRQNDQIGCAFKLGRSWTNSQERYAVFASIREALETFCRHLESRIVGLELVVPKIPSGQPLVTISKECLRADIWDRRSALKACSYR